MRTHLLFAALLLTALASAAQSAKSDSLYNAARALYERGQYRQAIPLFEQAWEMDKAEAPDDPDLAGNTGLWLASCHYRLGDKTKAETIEPMFYELPPTDRALTAKARSYAKLAANATSIDNAIYWMERCAEAEKEAFGDDCADVYGTYCNIAFFAMQNGNDQQCRDYIARAKAVEKHVPVSTTAWRGMAWGQEAALEMALGNTDEAKAAADVAWGYLKGYMHLYGTRYYDALNVILSVNANGNNIEDANAVAAVALAEYRAMDDDLKAACFPFVTLFADYYSRVGQSSVGLALMDEIVPIVEQDDETMASLLLYRSRLHRSAGDPDAAVADVEQSLQLAKRVYSQQPEMLAQTYFDQGECYDMARDFKKSRDAFKLALKAFKRQGEVYLAGQINSLHRLGAIATRGNHFDEALEYIDECLALMNRHKHENIADIAFMHHERGACLSGAKRRDEALEAYKESMKLYEQDKLGVFNPSYLDGALNVCTLLYAGNPQSGEAEDILAKMEQLYSGNGIKERFMRAQLWKYRAGRLSATGRYNDALELIDRCLVIVSDIEGVDLQNWYSDKFTYLLAANRKEDAQRMLQEYEADMERLYGRESRQYLGALLMACMYINGKGGFMDVADVGAMGDEVIELAGKVYDERDPLRVSAICTGAKIKSLTHPAEAKAVFLDALKAVESKGATPDNTTLLMIYSSLADIERNAGYYAKAVEYSEKCMGDILAGQPYGTMSALYLIHGQCLLMAGRLGDAENALKKGLEIAEGVNDGTNDQLVTAYMHLTQLYSKMGRPQLASEYSAKMMEMSSAAYGDSDIVGFMSRFNGLWQTYFSGRKDKCFADIEYISECFEKMGDAPNMDKGIPHRLRAMYWMYEGDMELAKSCIDLALAYGRNYESLQVASQIAFNMADYYLSAAYAREMLELAQDYLGKDAFETIAAHKLLGDATFQIGSVDEATENYRKAFDNGSRYIYGNLLSLTSEQRADFWASNYDFFRTYLPRLCYGYDAGESMSGLLYDAALFSNGLLLNVDKSVARAVQAAPQDVRDLYTEWSSKKECLGRMAVQNPEADASALQADVSALEKQLISRLREGGGSDDGTWSAATWQQVRKALPKGAAAVEFMDFAVDSLTNAGMALVLTRDMKYPRVCKLYLRMADDDLQWEGLYADTIIGNLIWGNLADAVAGCTDIYFTPQGPLCSIALESLPTSRLAAGVGMHRLSSTRELVRPRRKRRQQGSGATLYGGLNYDTSVAEMQADAERYPALRKRGFVADNLLFKRDLRDGDRYIPYLKGSRMEVDSITSLMSRVAGFSPVCKQWNDGTETSFKALSGAYGRVLHVSTHGFFVDPNDSVASALTVEDRALQQSGLLMSGAANKLNAVAEIPDDLDDGILTAAEIASLDLSDVDIAVLSACETALGRVTGEGVFGLQRGFKKAGAKSLLMSLWKVDDDATCTLVTEFYRRWLGDAAAGIAPQSKHAALEAAKACVRSNPDWDDPEYWAAFVLLDALD